MPKSSRYPQDATYWEPDTRNKFNETIFLNPIDIKVRWEFKNELFMDKNGKQILSNAIVYPLLPLPFSQFIKLEGYLALGAFSGQFFAIDPNNIESSFEIKMISSISSLTGLRVLEKIWL